MTDLTWNMMDQSDPFTAKLRAVFDLCDEQQQGFISVEHFSELAKKHFGAERNEDIQSIICLLDPEGDGRIHFAEFCQGVKQILELRGPTTPSTPPVNSVSSTSPFLAFFQVSSEETLTPPEEDTVSCGTQEASEVSTYNEYDVDEDSHQDTPECSSSPGSSNLLPDFPQSSVGQRLSTSALASHLYRSSVAFGADHQPDLLDNIDGNFVELSDKLSRLESQINCLSVSQMSSDKKHLRLKDDNTVLQEKINVLEEHLREVESRSVDSLHEEKLRHKESLNKTDKEKSKEIEILTQSLQHIQKEYFELKEDVPKLRAEVERLKREKLHLEDKLTDVEWRLQSLSDEHQDEQERSQIQRSQMEQEREVHAQLLDELTRELEALRAYKAEISGRAVEAHDTSLDPTLTKRQLEAHVVVLKETNARLREQVDDQQAQLLSRHLEAGRSLLKVDNSLADELEQMPRDKLVCAMKEQQEVNQKLRDYLDSLMLRIMEHHPALLEVTATPRM